MKNDPESCSGHKNTERLKKKTIRKKERDETVYLFRGTQDFLKLRGLKADWEGQYVNNRESLRYA